MKQVKVLNSFYVSSTSSYYDKNWVGEVSNELAERHGPKGTGFLVVLGDAEVKPQTDLKKEKK